MNVWAYCASDWWKATRAAGGVTPVLSPPFDHKTVGLAKATGSNLVYLNLHGYPGQPHLYGQASGVIGPTALTAPAVARYDWSGVVVFMEVCYSAADGGNPVARSFLDNGATAVIGSTTEAYGRMRPVVFDGEADRLFYFFRRAYGRSRNHEKALVTAKKWLRAISWPLDDEDKATLSSFVILETKEHEKN